MAGKKISGNKGKKPRGKSKGLPVRPKGGLKEEGICGSLLKNIPSVLWRSDKAGDIVYVSPNIKKIYGFTNEEILRGGIKLWFGRVHPEDLDKVKKTYSAAFKQNKKYDIEYRIKKKDGKWIWINDRSLGVHKENSKLYADGLFIEITKRKEAELLLLESQNTLKSIFDNTSEGILVVDAKSKKFFDGNKMMSTMLGYSMKELKKLSVKDIHPQKDLPYVISQFEKQVRFEISLAKDIPVKRKDGSVFYANVASSPVRISGKEYLVGSFRDISYLRASEKAIREYSEISENIVNSIPSGLFTYEYKKPDKLFLLSANPAAYDLTGKDAGIIGKEFNEIWPNAKALGITKKFIDVMKTYKIYRTEDLYYSDNKLEGAFRVTAFYMTKRRLAVAFDNITNEKRAELALKESEEKYRHIFNAANEGICIADLNGTILEVNPAMSRIYGYSYKELIGMNAEKLFHRGARSGFDKFISAMRSNKDYFVQGTDKKKDGTIIDIELKGSIVLFYGKKCALVVIQDISERKEWERVLEESEEKYRQIFSSATNAIGISDFKGNILDANKAMCKMYGYSHKEMVGLSAPDLITPASIPVFKEFINRLNRGLPFSGETIDVRKDGTPINVEASGVTINVSGVKRILVILRDITELKQIEQAKNNLVRDLSHSLKTPIVLTQMSLEILKKGIELNRKKQVEEAYAIGQKNIKKVHKDIENILKVFSLDIRKMGKLKKKKAAVRSVIIRNVKLIMLIARSRSISLKTDIKDPGARLLIDPKDLNIVVANVIENAVKFTEKGSIFVGFKASGKWGVITVRDTGRGISPDEKIVVFEKFYQKYSAAEGYGLGLFICKEITEMYGGEISIDSKGENKGTTVKIRLPKA